MAEEYFLSINDVAKKLDVPAYTLRYWEKQFGNVIKPMTGAGGRRYYRGDMVATINTIKDLLYTSGLTIAGVKKLLKEKNINDIKSDMSVAPRVEPKTVTALFSSDDDLKQALDLLKRAKKALV